MSKPLRFWMTGGAAVVLAALGGGRAIAAEERVGWCRASRYSLSETVERIEAAALRHGLTVFARVARDAGPRPDLDTEAPAQVVVLASSHGGTPVVMARDGSDPSVPLSVTVRERVEGGAEVLLEPAPDPVAMDGLPRQVAQDLAELPAVVAEALG